MKKILLLVSMVLFLVSCSDLSVNEEEVLKGSLPTDFNRSEYAKINNDVAKSQIAFEIQRKLDSIYPGTANENGGQGGLKERIPARKEQCGSLLLANSAFATKIYTEYLGCPRKGWDPNKACSEEYAGNSNYTTIDADGDAKCTIGACWHGGWDIPMEYDLGDYLSIEEYCRENDCELPFADILEDKVNDYIAAGRFASSNNYSTLIVMCKFVLPAVETYEKAESYLENFHYDSTLIEQHYLLVGRNEGRPYKYCEQGHKGEEKSIEAHAVKLEISNAGFYDYGNYLFCLDKTNWKIYVTQEKK